MEQKGDIVGQESEARALGWDIRNHETSQDDALLVWLTETLAMAQPC